MIDISDVTFIIPVRIESSDRSRNLTLSVGYLLNNTNAEIIIMESDEEQRVPKIIEDLVKSNTSFSKRIKYLFDSTKEKLFHRTRLLNVMLLESKTPIVVNYDCDILLPLSSYEQAARMCREGFDLIYPFSFGDGAQARVLLNSSDVTDFTKSYDLKTLKSFPWRAEYGFCQFFKRQSYLSGFMENENFMAYGPEDSERANRWVTLGFKVGRVDNLVYHLEHARTENSAPSNPFMKSNEDLYRLLRSMNAVDLRNYYENQEYYKNYPKSNKI